MHGPAPAAGSAPAVACAILVVVAALAAPAAGPPFPPAHALDTPGLRQAVVVHTGGYEFVVDVTSTFAIAGHEFNADERRLTLFAEGATASENLAEVVIPSDLIGGNLTFYVDGFEAPARVVAGADAAFATVRFSGGGAAGAGAGGGGSGTHTIDIVGTTYLPEFGAASVAVLAAAAAAAAVASRRAGGAAFRPA